MSQQPEACFICGADLSVVGRLHVCVPPEAQELARLWRLYEVAPRLVDPWPDEPGKYAAWLLVQQAEARHIKELNP